MEQTQQTPKVKMVTCAVCKRVIPETESVKKLHGAMIVCKQDAEKDEKREKEGEPCEFC